MFIEDASESIRVHDQALGQITGNSRSPLGTMRSLLRIMIKFLRQRPTTLRSWVPARSPIFGPTNTSSRLRILIR
jgi:hypothetical protein